MTFIKPFASFLKLALIEISRKAFLSNFLQTEYYQRSMVVSRLHFPLCFEPIRILNFKE